MLILLGSYLLEDTPTEIQKGITITAPDRPFRSDPMKEIKHLNASHVAVVPYAYVRPGSCQVIYNIEDWQWWGETPEGIRQTLQLAHKNGLHVMLKPQVYIPGGWVGDLSFRDKDQKDCFHRSYWTYLKAFAEMAEEENVELLCLGTEMKSLVAEDPIRFSSLIDSVKVYYSGALTYAANWDNYEQIPFWDRLDLIGINAYFPLSEADTPLVDELETAWQPVRERLAAFSHTQQKPIFFTEYGYLSVDHCAHKNWELETNIRQRTINQQCQCNALEALWNIFSKEDWWSGGYLWKWFPEGRGHEGYIPRDYTPQGKLGEQCLSLTFDSQN